MNNDLISRSALKKAIAEFHQKENERLHSPLWGSIGLNALDNIIDKAPTVEVPENEVNCVLTMFGKCSYNKTGCSDCEIKEKIRKALNERPLGEWIPIKTRPLTEEEKKEYPYSDFMYDCQLPEHGEDVFVTTKGGYVCLDTFYRKGDDRGFFEVYSRVVAWQSLPKPRPYKEEDYDK